jgi:uncharacterized protein (DUF697 family)
LKFVPFGGAVLSGSVAAVATYSIGKFAEAFFFYDKKVNPEDYKKEYKE